MAQNTFIIENIGGRIVVGVPNTFSQAWLKQKYHSQIYKIIQTQSEDRVKEITYKVQTKKEYEKQANELKKSISEQPKEQPTISIPSFQTTTSTLNSRYIFQNFIVGKANELAHAASHAVAEKPGENYNPLFIYGGVGLGKTHLMQAIGHKIKDRNENHKILYVTCEKFTNDFISSISPAKWLDFINTYRTPDVLLIDDIQFLTGKEGTQEAFFHTFNDLHQRGKQIVLTSDRPPKAIPTLEDRLLTRFEWGMIADISQPTWKRVSPFWK